MRMCVSVCVWVEHKAEQANPKQQQQLPLMRGLPASTQTSPAFPPTSFNTLDGFLRFVVAVAVAVAAGIEWLLHGVHFESEKSINFYCIRISVSHAATQRRRRRRQGRQRWLWQRCSLSKNSSRNRSVCVNMCCVCVCESEIDTCGESDLFTGDSHWHVKRNQMTQIEPNGQLMTIW